MESLYYTDKIKTEIKRDKKVVWTSEDEGMLAVKELLSEYRSRLNKQEIIMKMPIKFDSAVLVGNKACLF